MKFKIGNRVKSKIYGEGTVVEIDGHEILVEYDKSDYSLHGGKKNGNKHKALSCWWYSKPFTEIELIEKQFTKSDLQNGDIVTYRDGQTRTVECNRLISRNGDTTNYLSKYEDDLKYKIDSQKDIVKVERPVQYGVMFERKEEILDEVEKRYLANIIRPFRDKVTGISKMENKANTKNYIIIDIKADNDLLLPDFERRNYVYWNGNK